MFESWWGHTKVLFRSSKHGVGGGLLILEAWFDSRDRSQKYMTTKKNIDPGKPISRPMAPITTDTNWGKQLTKPEWKKLMKKLDAKKKEREMSKLSETLARALAKKQGKTHVDGSDADAVVEKKAKVKPSAGPAKKPPTRSAGRGR